MRAISVTLLALLVAACGSTPGLTTLPTVSTAVPTAASPQTTAEPTQSPSATPSPTGTPSVTAAFDGRWASQPLTRQMMVDALTRHGLDASLFDNFFPESGRIDYRMAEAVIGDGRWEHREYEDNIWIGGWNARIASATSNTIVVSDDEIPCTATFALSRTGNELTITVEDDQCPDDDVVYEVAMYEAAPFTLVQTADWQPSDFEGSPAIEIGPSTSRDRLISRHVGTVDAAPLGYLEYLPPSYSEEADPSPLLLFFHGSGESGTGDAVEIARLKYAGIPEKINNNVWPDDRPFVVLSPQHDDSEFPDFCMEADEIDAFIAFALSHYNVDPDRVYLTGLSCGAIGIWNYLDQYGGGAVAAAVPIAGNGLTTIQNRGCALGATPIWAFHGLNDQSVPVEAEVYPLTVLQGCTDPSAVDARLTVFPLAAHDVWTRTYGGSDGIDIYGWLLSHELAD